MKKITLFVLSIVALASAAMAQGAMTINAADFTSNPARFNGKTIAISGVKLDLTAAAAPTATAASDSVGAGLPKDEDVTEMSVKELKHAIVEAGLESQSVGFCEKSEFVALLLEHRAGNIAVERDFTSEIDQIMQNLNLTEREPVRSALLAASGDVSLATESLLDSMELS